MNGYIYIRTNEYWDLYDAYKLGKSSNILDRENNYITSEICRGKYIMVIELNIDIMDIVEEKLQQYFNKLGYHIKFNAGTEFYKKEIIKTIIPYLTENKINHKILSESEIKKLIRKTRITENNTCISLKTSTYKPYELQQIIIDKAYNYFQENDKGLLILTCGVGKTLISLWITMQLNLQTIIIGVPNILLLNQWEKTISYLASQTKSEKVPYMIVANGVNKDDIILFLKKNNNKCIIITTYASSHKVVSATKKIKFTFDMKINDEVHHLTSTNMELENKDSLPTKTNVEMLKIPSTKMISLTATLKQLDSNNDNIISNDNEQYFGKIIDKKCLLWAIQNNIVCDYTIQTIITDEEELEQFWIKSKILDSKTKPLNEQQLYNFKIDDETDKRLFLSAYSSLKSINGNHSHHLLIYSNNMDNSKKLIQYIQLLLEHKYFSIDGLYYSSYNSMMKPKDQVDILDNFENAKYGIITCVYCLGEGYDLPLLDGVVFSETMTSNIRIVQSALRASRKNNKEPNKITKIILPILNKNDWLDNNDNNDFKKVREVIYQMGLEDETISQKIKVYKILINKHMPKQKPKDDTINDFGEYDDELTQKIRLKTIKRMSIGISFTKAKHIVSEKNIISKEHYYTICDIDNRLSKEPEILYEGEFTNWIDYLGIPQKYYDLKTCKDKVSHYLSTKKKIDFEFSKITKKLKKKDDMFPPYDLWCEYYNINDMTEIIKHNNDDDLVEF
jgi:predicted helicase